MGAPLPYMFFGGVPIKVHFIMYFFLVNYRNTRRFLYNYFLFLSVICVGQSFSWRIWKQVVSITGYCGCRLKPSAFGYYCNVFCFIIFICALSLKNPLLVKKVSLVYDLFMYTLLYFSLPTCGCCSVIILICLIGWGFETWSVETRELTYVIGRASGKRVLL